CSFVHCQIQMTRGATMRHGTEDAGGPGNAQRRPRMESEEEDAMAPRKRTRVDGGMATVSSDLNVKTAWLYHVEGLTQAQIADRLNISRVKVMRTLAACTAEGVVVTTINAE